MTSENRFEVPTDSHESSRVPAVINAGFGRRCCCCKWPCLQIDFILQRSSIAGDTKYCLIRYGTVQKPRHFQVEQHMTGGNVFESPQTQSICTRNRSVCEHDSAEDLTVVRLLGSGRRARLSSAAWLTTLLATGRQL